jgi:hypothetical protein
MPVFQGNANNFEQDPSFNIPCKIISWYLTNTSGLASPTTLAVFNPATSAYVYLYSSTIADGTSVFSSVPFILLPGYKIIITSSSGATINYYISIE